VAKHRFRLGQKVRLTRDYPYRPTAAGDYQVVGQLPDSKGELRYRIKSTHKPQEIVVKESELKKA
jgi:hypothetical protein